MEEVHNTHSPWMVPLKRLKSAAGLWNIFLGTSALALTECLVSLPGCCHDGCHGSSTLGCGYCLIRVKASREVKNQVGLLLPFSCNFAQKCIKFETHTNQLMPWNSWLLGFTFYTTDLVHRLLLNKSDLLILLGKNLLHARHFHTHMLLLNIRTVLRCGSTLMPFFFPLKDI